MKLDKVDWNEAGGTCLQGYIVTTYKDLVSVFGEPTFEEGDKVTAEWNVKIDGVVCTIYDWKEYTTPQGPV
jgi:hypothetical protein